MNILFVVHDLLYPDVDGGKKIVLGRVLKAIASGDDVSVFLVNYRRRDSSVFKAFIEKAGASFFEHRPNYSVFQKIKSMASINPYYCEMLVSDYGSVKELEDLLKINCFDVVSFESIVFILFISKLSISLDNSNVNILMHNVESVFFKQLAHSEARLHKKIFFISESIKLGRIERSMSNNERVTFTFLSDSDLRAYNRQGKFVITKNSKNHNWIYLPKKVSRRRSSELFYLFPASISFPPNFYALDRILEVYERSDSQIPVYVTGGLGGSESFRNKFTKVRFTGLLDIDELYDLYGRCLAVISPIFTGSGIKLKNLEAIRLGVPLIATEFSMEGIPVEPDSEVYISSDSPEQFVQLMMDFNK